MMLRLVRIEPDREEVLRAIARSIASGQTTCIVGDNPLVGIPLRDGDLIDKAIGCLRIPEGPVYFLYFREWFSVPEFVDWETVNEYANVPEARSCERRNYARR